MTPASEALAQLAVNRRGILAMIGAMSCFVVNDTLVKYASQTLPAAQLIFVRGAMAVLLVLAVAQATGATRRLREIARGWVVGRTAVDALGSLLYLLSLFHLPIATATAINMTSPLMIAILAALLLGERVGIPRALATLVGFIGVLLIVQPRGGALSVYALVCLLATGLLSLRDLMTRRIHAGTPSILIALANTVTVCLLAGSKTLVDGWQVPTAMELGLLAVASVFLVAAYYLTVVSVRHGDLSLIAPFRYSGLLVATVAGLVVWGDRPNALAWCGIGLLVASGIYVLRASRRVRAAAVAPD